MFHWSFDYGHVILVVPGLLRWLVQHPSPSTEPKMSSTCKDTDINNITKISEISLLYMLCYVYEDYNILVDCTYHSDQKDLNEYIMQQPWWIFMVNITVNVQQITLYQSIEG